MKDETVLKLIQKRKQNAMMDAMSSVEDAVRFMDANNTDILACSIQGRFAGLLTRFDYIKNVMLKNLDANIVKVIEVMNFDVPVIRQTTLISEAFSILSQKNVSCLTVLSAENNSFIGVVGEVEIRKVIHQALVSAENENRMIMNYIYGENYGLCANY